MKSFNDLESQNVRWVQQSMWNNTYELRTDAGDVVATMKRPSMWRSAVEIEAVGNRWRFERKGFWQNRVEATSIGTGEVAATYRAGMMKGSVQLADGRVFHWQQGNWWGTKWTWTDEHGEPIIGFKTGGAFTLNGELNLDPDVMEMKTMSLLVFLGWYLIVLNHEDSSVAATVAAT
jgi:hypothetical protein